MNDLGTMVSHSDTVERGMIDDSEELIAALDGAASVNGL